ncbi:MAG TPA: LysR substrate-binding domain-containing protein [Acidimicrobiales bacterium]|jgi:hypothetical protein|nr:LysR substrate-binding domain-containing protein [Acidimicrobiales bacterium]
MPSPGWFVRSEVGETAYEAQAASETPRPTGTLGPNRRSSQSTTAPVSCATSLGLSPTPDGWAGPIREIGAEEFVMATAPGTAMPGKPPTVRIADLARHQWVHYTPPSGLADVLDAACEKPGFQPHVAVRTSKPPRH